MLTVLCLAFDILSEGNLPLAYGWAILSLDQERNTYTTLTEHRPKCASMFRRCCVGIPLLFKRSDREEIAEVGLISKDVSYKFGFE